MSQRLKIWAHLRHIGPITPLKALRHYGCLRLGARIYELKRREAKKANRRIKGRMVSLRGKRFKEFSLA